MKIFIPKSDNELFLEKLKEIKIIDDYNLDGGFSDRFCASTSKKMKDVHGILPLVPVGTVVTDELDYPGKQFILCIGEVSFPDFLFLENKYNKTSILTKKSTHVRFNMWIPFARLEEFYQETVLNEVYTMNAQIQHSNNFVLHCSKKNEKHVLERISKYTSNFTIKENEICVKLSLHDFSNLYPQIHEKVSLIDIVEDVFV